jgi:hypothetical protein
MVEAGKSNSVKGKGIVFVCGAARTGSTMLDLMLGNSPDAFSCGEIYALFRPWRRHHFNPVCACGQLDCSAWRSIDVSDESGFHGSVLRQPDINFVIDSSKDIRWVLDSNYWAQHAGIPVANVLIWKDPIDLAFSHWKRGSPVDYYKRSFSNYYERFLNLDVPFVAIPFRALVNDTEKVLGHLCSVLGMSYESGRERFWEKEHHHYFGSAGTARQVKQGDSRIGMEPEYPEEFLQAYERDLSSGDKGARVQEVVSQLQKYDASTQDELLLRVPNLASGALKPAWYYKHCVKAFVRRFFPERAAVLK